ncbi:MAG TPA: CDP-diacylglycerol--glycerol-3-phosphate 3-phosphatidyltransferase [Parvularculaceae bacterium]|nr:CDP-diacylglycerol--glycerol-3-phosphate 3-phosphatidyltransferase [Parvularculaceae bacterium]
MANALTLGRILLIIPFVAVFLADAAWNMKAALAIFLIAALSDFLDGYLARARNEVSALGAALDPLADKLLVAAALILLTHNGVIHGLGVIAVLIIVLREILVSGLRETMAARGEPLVVTTLAKWKTLLQLAAAALLLAAAPGGFVTAGAARSIGTGLLWASAVLTFFTGADYALKSARALRRAGG